MIVALLNQKGGVGKTTLATHIAGELAMRGLHVILLDADPQGSSLDWTQRRSQQGLPRLFSAVGLARETLHQEAPELARRADHVIIDGPPRIAALARSALLAAERVLIPVQPSPYDLWASAEMVALIREAQVFRPALRAAFVINRRVSTTIIGREARQSLAEQPLPALRSEVRQRIVFADSVAAGRLARETAPDSAAAREIAEAWIRQGDADALNKGDLYTARLTLDVTPALRARIKIAAFGQGVTVAELLRGLLEREFPENRMESTP